MIIEEIKNIKSGRRELRKFGITVSIVLGLLGGVFLSRERDCYSYFFVLSAMFLFLGTAMPNLLKAIHKIWMTLALLLGWLVTRVILIVLFYFVFALIGLLGRVFGKDFLDLKFDKNVNSYWISKRTVSFEKSDYERQF